ncbi:CTP:molybdopterin cytidylyltransferase MocA [Yoonia maricola]|uniref:CTP:molybdopterin cytidylyltransferase MocA n=1 Tax=Yoonia maricola TaxID=420999 RepID=A0A2M8WLM2_9RHOB|nr:nucleotidyltransferase family protein [Yoonia maricola]PJI91827.1 CTP:molybdopterin cytidylyltransferase MocA [Yoonia maricola]
MIPILILAAGQSSRMGTRDKMLEDVDGVPLLRRQVRMASAAGEPVYVALHQKADSRHDTIADLDVRILTVPQADEGMSGTMRGAVAQLPKAPAFMILLGDLVALETSDLKAVLDARATHPAHVIWRGTTQDGKPGHPIIFDASLRPDFADLSGDGGGESLVKQLHDRTHLVPLPGNRARLDLDTPEDWAAWRASKV